MTPFEFIENKHEFIYKYCHGQVQHWFDQSPVTGYVYGADTDTTSSCRRTTGIAACAYEQGNILLTMDHNQPVPE